MTDRSILFVGKLKQPVATGAELRQIDQVRGKVPAVDRVYPQLLFTQNLIKAQLVNPAESKYTYHILHFIMIFRYRPIFSLQ